MLKRTIRARNQLTVPAEVLKALGDLNVGDEIGFRLVEGKVILTPLMTVPVRSQAKREGKRRV